MINNHQQPGKRSTPSQNQSTTRLPSSETSLNCFMLADKTVDHLRWDITIIIGTLSSLFEVGHCHHNWNIIFINGISCQLLHIGRQNCKPFEVDPLEHRHHWNIMIIIGTTWVMIYFQATDTSCGLSCISYFYW